MLFTNRNWIVV